MTTSAPQTLGLTVTVVSPDAQTNTATISHADQFDPNPGNNTASATETPQQADLALTKTVSNPTPNVGDTSPTPSRSRTTAPTPPRMSG